MFFDTDAGGVVHNIAYLRFIETNRSLLAEKLGWPLGEMLNRAAKINTLMVPYKSTTDALVDLLANRIQIWFTPIASGAPELSASAT